MCVFEASCDSTLSSVSNQSLEDLWQSASQGCLCRLWTVGFVTEGLRVKIASKHWREQSSTPQKHLQPFRRSESLFSDHYLSHRVIV